MLNRIGFYCWAGPALTRMTKTKYFNPKLDHESTYEPYTYKYLKKAKDLFGITDVWVMYSWGFNDQHEAEDYEHILSNLPNFKKLGLKTHAYLQGPNLVYNDFKNHDYWARDEKGRLITYYRGRKVTCVNNPYFQKFFFNRLKRMVEHDFDGIFIDNLQMGQLGIPVNKNTLPFVFAGCNCHFCQSKYYEETGQKIPLDFEKDPAATNRYLEFRSQSLINFVANAGKIVLAAGKEFGANNYDPKFDTKLIYGYDLEQLSKFQDYLLFENHAFKKNKLHNNYINNLKINKPIFVVSYEKGIGYEKQFTQQHFNLIFSEAKHSKFFPVLKASEYKTKGVWHSLRLQGLQKPNHDLIIEISAFLGEQHSKTTKFLRSRFFKKLSKKFYNRAYTLVMERRALRPLMRLAYELVLH